MITLKILNSLENGYKSLKNLSLRVNKKRLKKQYTTLQCCLLL